MLKLTFLQTTSIFIVAVMIFVLIILFYLSGYAVRKRMVRKNPDLLKHDLGAINGTLLGLLGLLLAFTFSMASSRYDMRRNIIIEEANNIGTAILRTDLYPDSLRSLLRTNFKQYVEERIGYFEAGLNYAEVAHHYLAADSISKEIWKIATTDARVNSVMVRSAQMVPALNAMIDITTTRRSSGESTVPDSILYFLFLLCCCSSFLLGYENTKRIDWIMVLGLATMLSFTVYNILDLDRSRSGMIDMNIPNNKIVELRSMFN